MIRTPGLVALLAALSLSLWSAPGATYEWPGKMAEVARGLQSDAAKERVDALRGLVHFPYQEIRPLLVGALQDRAPQVQVAAMQTLAQLGQRQDSQLLYPFLNDLDPELRRAAIAALGKLRDPKAVDALLRTLGDPDPGVRVATLEALGDLGLDKAQGPVAALLSDRNREVSSKAIEVLARAGDGNAVFPLLEKIKDPVLRTQLDAIGALGLLGDPRATLPLLGLLYDPQTEVRMAVVEALGRLGDHRATPHLSRALLTEHSSPLGYRLIHTLGQLQDPAALPVLFQVMRHSGAGEAVPEAIALIGPEATPAVVQTLVQSQDRDEARRCLESLLLLFKDPRLSQGQRSQVALALLARRDSLPVPPEQRTLALAASGAPEVLEFLLLELQRLSHLPRQGKPERGQLGILLALLGQNYQDARVVRPLLTLYPRLDQEERALALAVLESAPSVEALPLLLRALEDEGDALRATRALGRLDDPQSTQALLGLLQKGQAPLLQEAAVGLGQHSTPGLQEALRGLLGRRGPVQHGALLALGARLRLDPQPDSLRALTRLVEESQDPQAVSLALDALGSAPQPGDAQVLLARYQAAPLALRRKLLQVLGEWRSQEAKPLLLEALGDPEPLIRGEAAWALGLLGDPAQAPALLPLLREDAWPVALNASAALALLKNPEATQEAQAQLHRQRGAVRANLLLALHQQGAAPQGRELLAWARLHGSPQVLQAARRVLRERDQGQDAIYLQRLERLEASAGARSWAPQGAGLPGDSWKRYLLTDEELRPITDERAHITRGDGLTLGRASDLSGIIRVEHLPPGPTLFYAVDEIYVSLD